MIATIRNLILLILRPDYCFKHNHPKKYICGIGTQWYECEDCTRERHP